jgi:hypothetical protein
LEILKENLEWKNLSYNLSYNPAAIELLKEHPEKIYWKHFSENPSIFENENENEKNKIINNVISLILS